MLKSSMLQRQLKKNSAQITRLEYDINYDKEALGRFVADGWEDATQQFVSSIQRSRAEVKQLAELQVFLKRELQEAYDMENFMCTYKHDPQFMAEAPPAEMGSFVEDEQ